ncbi:MAG: PrsW family intramembrane metalloprotease [Gemmatimonadaceae bacterium]
MRWTADSRPFHAALLLGALSLLVMLGELGAHAFMAGLMLAVLPVPAYLALALWLDRYEPEPARMLATTFLWGASVAVFLSLVINSTAAGLADAMLGGMGDQFAALFTAPLVEEGAKGLALLLVFLQERDEFDNVTDGVVYAAMVGLGFAMTENVLYYGRAMTTVPGDPWPIFVLRGLASPFAHPLFTAMIGIGLGIARERGRGGRDLVLIPLVGSIAAVVLHTAWNLSASLDILAPAYLLVMVPVFAGTLLVVRDSLRRESRVIREQLAHLNACGTITDDDMAALCSARLRLAASVRAAREGGLSGWRRRSRFHRTATELAFRRWRAARDGAETTGMDEDVLLPGPGDRGAAPGV